MSYRMDGGKTPGSSANETGTGLPPSLTGWEKRKSLPFKGAKKTRFADNAPKNAAENAEFIEAGGGSRPSF